MDNVTRYLNWYSYPNSCKYFNEYSRRMKAQEASHSDSFAKPSLNHFLKRRLIQPDQVKLPTGLYLIHAALLRRPPPVNLRIEL